MPKAETQPVTATQYKIGDRVVSGDVAYTVTGVKTATSLGDQYFNTVADGVFLIIDMKIENLGKESKTIGSSYMKIIDSQGREFDSDDDAWAHLENNILIKQIQPGLPTSGQVVFDVPPGEIFNLQVSGSLWGGDEQLIVLGKA